MLRVANKPRSSLRECLVGNFFYNAGTDDEKGISELDFVFVERKPSKMLSSKVAAQMVLRLGLDVDFEEPRRKRCEQYGGCEWRPLGVRRPKVRDVSNGTYPKWRLSIEVL